MDRGSLLSTALNMLADIPCHCPIVKYLIMDVSVGQVLRGFSMSAFNPLAAQRYVVCKKGFSSVYQAEYGLLKHLQ